MNRRRIAVCVKRRQTGWAGWIWPILVFALHHPLPAEDWPVFRHDSRRSGMTSETIPAAALQQSWVWQSDHPPQPAWAGPAKWDAYRNLRGLRSMRNYDPVFHVIVAGGSVFFGSSVDDSVYCLDAATGETKWSFCSDGPVRLAPTYADGKVYFGSDDGRAYCLRAADGALVWKFGPGADGRLVLNNGRFIPLWPCRSGVLVDRGTAYFSAGLLPWKESYLCAVDAQTGLPAGPGRFVRKYEELTMEGAPAASEDLLIMPQGRVPPLVFRRADGESLGPLKGGGGGCFVVLTQDAHILHGPGNKTGWITDSDAGTRASVASHNNANAMIVAGEKTYLLTDDSLAAVSRSRGKVLWKTPCGCPCELILAGETLFAGGDDRVAAYDAGDGSRLWEGKVSGRAYGLAVADGGLFVSTDEGAVYCFRPGEKAVAPGDTTEAPEFRARRAKQGEDARLAMGPYARFVGPDAAVIRWQTQKPSPTLLEYGLSGREPRTIENPQPTIDHEATLKELRRNRTYFYTIWIAEDDRRRATQAFELDTFFNYSPRPAPQRASPYPGDSLDSLYAGAAERILTESGVDKGICLVLGCGQGRLAYELAKRSGLRVIGVDDDPENVAAARRALQRAGLYGARVAVRHVPSPAPLPFTGQFANLVVSERLLLGGECPVSAAEMFRALRPNGGVAYLGQPRGAPNRLEQAALEAWLNAAALQHETRTDAGGLWSKVIREPLLGAGEWTHLYGRPDNSAYGGEALGGATATDDLEVQWIGRPGPRYQADRNGRKPSPLAANGRLFLQGLERIVALDAYNGTVLWSLEVPPFRRFNVPRDCSNWCADEDSVFAAVRGQCWRIDAATGDLSRRYDVIGGSKTDWTYDWGYVARTGDLLLGSAVKQDSAFTDFWGGPGWYDATGGAAAAKVCSENLFALREDSGREIWTYADGVIVNPTITVGPDRVYFVESRSAAVRDSRSRRLTGRQLRRDRYLVALDVRTGRRVWERPIDTAPGDAVVYMAYGKDRLAMVASDDKEYRVYAYDASNGQDAWNARFDWPGADHGKHMSRPAIAGDALYVRPRVFDLATGKALDRPMPAGGCGTYAATDHALVFRAGTITVWDPSGGKTSNWSRLRPDCWLSTIPACGMLLSAEGGGGCSCGAWMETSIGFIPRQTR